MDEKKSGSSKNCGRKYKIYVFCIAVRYMEMKTSLINGYVMLMMMIPDMVSPLEKCNMHMQYVTCAAAI